VSVVCAVGRDPLLVHAGTLASRIAWSAKCPRASRGEESFDITVCSPEWLARACSKAGGILNSRHHLVVTVEDFDKRAVQAWLAARVQEVEADPWGGIGDYLEPACPLEFEDYPA